VACDREIYSEATEATENSNIDLLVEDQIVVEVKSAAAILPVHLPQTITYVRLAGKPAGLLIDFNVKRLVDGVRRVVNDDPSRRKIAMTSE